MNASTIKGSALVALLPFIAMLGCSNAGQEGVTGPELGPLGPDGPAAAISATDKVTTGGASFDDETTILRTIPLDAAGNREKISFNARRESDGVTADGQFQARIAVGEDFHGEVVCFELDDLDNRISRVGGVITHSSDPLIVPGETVIWTVQDNGEGGTSPSDRYSGLFFGEPNTHCANPAGSLTLIETDRGNVKVHS